MRVAVIIPIYHNDFSETEMCSLQQCLKILSNYPIIFVIPDDLKLKNDLHNVGDVQYERVPSKWMSSIDEYSRMCCSIEFYNRFTQYDYILIYQLDAFVFRDELLAFCNMGYDYYGAPWLRGLEDQRGKSKLYVGNGGFSLRKVSTCLEVLQKREYNGEVEDIFWARCDSPSFKVAPVDVALRFSFETYVEECFLMNDCQLPFGCHAWGKWNFRFWKPFFEKLGYNLNGMEDTFERQFTWKCWNLSKNVLRNCAGFERSLEKEIFVWGTKEEGVECGYFLRKMGIDFFTYIDSNSANCIKPLWGMPVCLPEEIRIDLNSIVIVATKRFEKEIMVSLEAKGVDIKQNIYSYNRIVNNIENYIKQTGCWSK